MVVGVVGSVFVLSLVLEAKAVSVFESLPKIHVNELSIKEFDSIFLNQRPIILRGATTCPEDMNFETIVSRQFCDGTVPGNYVKTRDPHAGQWAGLKAGDPDETIDFVNFCKSMRSGAMDVTKSSSTTALKKNEKENDNDGASNDNQKHMGNMEANTTNQLRFMFDVPMVDICPSLLDKIRIPPHLVDIFASQFLWRHLSDEDPKKCENVPFYNMYLAEGGFQTELHVDSAHTAFVASMCVGRKKWRIMTPHDHAVVHSQLSGKGMTDAKQEQKQRHGTGIEGKQVPTTNTNGTTTTTTWVMSDIQKPFDTWSDESPLHTLESDNAVIIYEGILEPGETLYIPPGAPHAATTLDKSLMVASNDQSIQSLEQIVSYCDVIHDEWDGCNMYREKFTTVQENYKRYMYNHNNDNDNNQREEPSSFVSSTTRRTTEMTFAQSFDCEKAFHQLSQKRLELNPQNFMVEVQKGPIIIMKYVRSCIRCITLYNQLQQLVATTDKLDPPLRLGVLHCPHGHCPKIPDNINEIGGNGDTHIHQKEYRKVLPMVRSECPEFVFVRPVAPLKNSATTSTFSSFRGSPTDEEGHPKTKTPKHHHHNIITVAHYYGPLTVDFLKVWISLQNTGSITTMLRVDHDISFWWKWVIVSCHVIINMTVTTLQACGVPPMADDVAMISIAMLLFCSVPFIGYCCSSAANKPKRKEE